jgi:hypothetical protein
VFGFVGTFANVAVSGLAKTNPTRIAINSASYMSSAASCAVGIAAAAPTLIGEGVAALGCGGFFKETVDDAVDHYLDGDQLRYFEIAAETLKVAPPLQASGAPYSLFFVYPNGNQVISQMATYTANINDALRHNNLAVSLFHGLSDTEKTNQTSTYLTASNEVYNTATTIQTKLNSDYTTVDNDITSNQSSVDLYVGQIALLQAELPTLTDAASIAVVQQAIATYQGIVIFYQQNVDTEKAIRIRISKLLIQVKFP